LTSYSLKLDEERDVHRLELTLERMPAQLPFDFIKKAPWPSQLDDWHLYEQIEAGKRKMMESKQRMLAWTTQRAHEELERQQWSRNAAQDNMSTTDRAETLPVTGSNNFDVSIGELWQARSH
jgi:hypothetical protein